MTLGRRTLSCLWTVLALLAFSNLLEAQSVKRYVVQLRDEPVISHMRRQGAGAPRRMELESAEASSYRSQIATRQETLKRRIAGLRDSTIHAQMDTVFNGLAVSVHPEDVEALKNDPSVANVFPSIQYHKVLDAALPLINVPQAWANPGVGSEDTAGAGIRIGIIDTGIDINHPMLQDATLVPPTGFPKFTVPTALCSNPDSRFTNSKVIVARNYVSLLGNPDQNCDAMDRDGHGTFVAGIAAGRRVSAPLASISGVAPKAFLGSYKVFGTPGSNDDASLIAIMKAIEDAVKDGMNVINLSLGAESTSLPSNDPLDIAVTNAVNAGVIVVVAAGNSGPGTGSITSPGTAPGAITVGATSNSRIIANPLVITAGVPVPAVLSRVGALPGNGPKISASVSAPLADVGALGAEATGCSAMRPGSLAGKLALMVRGVCNFSVKIGNAASAGASAAIVYNNQNGQPPVIMDVQGATSIPSVMIGNTEGLALSQFISLPEAKAQGTLQAEQAAIPTAPNRMATFSASGPSIDFNIKPDLVAPGTTIYSAAQRNFEKGVQFDSSGFISDSGTSFSSPMVAGAAALMKQAAPGSTTDQIKSALVNTAGKVVTSSQGGPTGVLAQGNGLLNVSAAITAPLIASPVSISFGIHQKGDLTFGPLGITITNTSPIADTVSVTNTQVPGSARATIRLNPPAGFSLNPGESTLVSFSASPTQTEGTVEGYLSFQSQNTQTSISVPYWGTYTQPSVNFGGVVNAASFSFGPSSVTQGEIISIFGTGLANTLENTVTIPWPLSLGGASVKIGGQTAPILSASANQINAQVPFEVSGLGVTNLTVSLNGVTSPPIPVSLAAAAPGIYTVNQGGTGIAAALHAANSSQVTPNNPARAGEFLEIFATGLGAVAPAVLTGAQGSSDPLSTTRITPAATIGGVTAPVSFSGLAPSFVGLYQVNLQVPPGLPSGNQTLILSANGVASNPVLLPVGP